MTDATTNADRLTALAKAATQTAQGLGKVAGAKPDETPLRSDARTFRGVAAMLTSLSDEARQRERTVAQLRAVLQRIAMLEARGAGERIERGDWKGLVEELQAMAQDVLGAGTKSASRLR